MNSRPRVERALAEQPISSTPTSAVSRRKPGSIDWRFLGFGLAAAAALMLLAKVGNDRPARRIRRRWPRSRRRQLASLRPRVTGKFIPTGVTQVVYHARDEGLVFTEGVENPVRRLSYRKRETMQWRQPDTGASLRVSYPSEEVVLMPVSGQ